MKKIVLLMGYLLTIPQMFSQNIQDAMRYSQNEIQGTARFRALSGAFGALGGDISAISLNPASSSVFTRSQLSFSMALTNNYHDTQYGDSSNSSTDTNFNLPQIGGVFVLKNLKSDSPWKTIALSIGYDRTANYRDEWTARGTTNTSIDSYFLNYAQGLPLVEISRFQNETYTDAYIGIGEAYGYGNQQAFLGYESYILEPVEYTDDNTSYYSNIGSGNYDQKYYYDASGYNSKVTFNASAQYEDWMHLGVNLNTHFLYYDQVNRLIEGNNNPGSTVNYIDFENHLTTFGTGFSFQIGSIFKIFEGLRAGLTYTSPTWYYLEEETEQFLNTQGSFDGPNSSLTISPYAINVFPSYRLQEPGSFAASLAYIFGRYGLISFDYSLKNHGNTEFRPTSDTYFSEQNALISDILTTSSTYRIGGEVRLNEFSLRGGYRFHESPYKNNSIVGDLYGYSLGIGYKFGNASLDFTYDGFHQNTSYQLYETGLTNRANFDNRNNNFTLSLNVIF